MTEIMGSDMDATLAQQFGGALQLGAGNLISTQSFGTFGGAAAGGYGGFENVAGFGPGADAQYATSSYEAYTHGGDMGAAMGGVQAMETYSSDVGMAGGAYGGLEGAHFATSSAEEFSSAAGGLSAASGGFATGVGALGALESSGAVVGEASSMEFSASSGGGGGGAGFGVGAGALLPLNAYKIQVDANPTVIRRQMAGAATVQRQNIIVRFLRPPAPPAPGPLIIKEIRPPQPRPAPPLVIRQRPPRPRTPPPLILRERPPRMPVVTKTHTVIKRLAALPPPPRQVIIERYPALPAKPRDVIIERWLQYGPLPKRKVIYQRAAAARSYRVHKNLIVQYVSPRPAIQRVFRRLGIISMNPSSYISQYGATLLDASALLPAARAAGVVESIAPPALVYPLAVAAGGAEGMVSSAGASFYTSSEEQGIAGGFGGVDSSALALVGAGEGVTYGGTAIGGAEYGVADLSSATGFNAYSMVGGGEGMATESSAAFATMSSEFDGGVASGGFEYSSTSEAVEGGIGATTGAGESYESATYTSSTTAVNEA